MGSPHRSAERSDPASTSDSDRESQPSADAVTSTRKSFGFTFPTKGPERSPPKSTTGRINFDDTVEPSVGGLAKAASSSALSTPKRAPEADVGASPPSKKLKYVTQDTEDDSHGNSANDTNSSKEEAENEDASKQDKAGQEESHRDITNYTNGSANNINDENASDEDKTSEDESHQGITNDTNGPEEDIGDEDVGDEGETGDPEKTNNDHDTDDFENAMEQYVGEGEEESTDEGTDQEENDDAEEEILDLLNSPGSPDSSPSRATQVALLFPADRTVRVTRKFLADNTKLLDHDPNVGIIEPVVQRSEFFGWRDLIEEYDGLSNVPWPARKITEFFDTLVVDEKLKGRWSQDFEGLNSVVNNVQSLKARNVGRIARRTGDMMSSEVFEWACNGLHHVYQQRGLTLEEMTTEVRCGMTRNIKKDTEDRVVAKIEDLEQTYGGKNRDSGVQHPGHLIIWRSPPGKPANSKDTKGKGKGKGNV